MDTNLTTDELLKEVGQLHLNIIALNREIVRLERDNLNLVREIAALRKSGESNGSGLPKSEADPAAAGAGT